MQTADAAQIESLRLWELREQLSELQKLIFDLAFKEITEHRNLEIGTEIDQAQLKLKAAIQTINVELRKL